MGGGSKGIRTKSKGGLRQLRITNRNLKKHQKEKKPKGKLHFAILETRKPKKTPLTDGHPRRWKGA